MDSDKITFDLNRQFNLANLGKQIDAGFSYIVLTKANKLDWLKWTQAHDKERNESSHLMLPQSSFVFDGELPVVVFKDAVLAQSFAAMENEKEAGAEKTSVLKMGKTPAGIVFSPV